MLNELIHNPITRKQCLAKGKQRVLEVTGTANNACASVASEYLMLAGVLDKPFLNTRGLCDALQGQPHEVVLHIDELQSGDVAFSCDNTGRRGASDHVFIIYEVKNWDALVVDNYSKDAHLRNLGKGSKTPFAFALRML